MNYYNEIKKELINNEIYQKAKNYSKNRSDLITRYNVGKLLSEAGKHYGENIIEKYSRKLTIEFGKGYSKRNLWQMLQFYELKEKMQTLSAQLSWSHYCELLSLNCLEEIKYYIKVVEQNNLSVRQLRDKIKNSEYERLPLETKKIIKNEIPNLMELVKNSIMLKGNNNNELISEKILKQLVLEDIEYFLEELGDDFAFIKSEYKIKYENRYNYIDLLLFNYKYNCFVVVELKITELKKEHIGQIQFYMNYIDRNLRKDYQDKTIGIIICKKNNKFIIEYCSDSRIISREYMIINNNLQKEEIML